MAGAMPARLLSNFHDTLSLEDVGADQPSYQAYFVHRHSLYALAEFFGWRWQQHGIPEGMIHTGTTVFIELLRNDTGGHEVVFKQWSPHCGASDYIACPREMIPFKDCQKSTVCSLQEFAQMIQKRTDRTGDYQHLCASH